MSCTPPVWIWAADEHYDEDERLAGEIPSTPECRQIKEVFEEAAGPNYLRYAYLPQYRLARTLCRFVINGLASNEDFNKSDQLQSEWDELREALKLARRGEEFDGEESDGLDDQ
ncbi:hypothetical protein N7488_000997 [Penicillium malachiteum]|nr:hypothetical protein N7488_000997 [Penicillium malachiteum]